MDMDTKEIAPGVFMPVLSIGTGGLESQKAYSIVSDWLALGGTGIDTALNYHNQDSVQRAIEDAHAATREDLFLTTKIPDCNATQVAQNIEDDLALLNTSYVDLMLLHAPRRGDCLQAWKILEDYYASNRTRAIGVSNFRPSDLEPLLQGGSIVPHVNQIRLNLLDWDKDTIEYCTQHGIVVEAYSPLGRGSGKVVHHPLVEQIATSHKVSAYQIALRWILQHGWIGTFQSSSREHQATDADVFGFSLTLDEMNQLDGIGNSAGSTREQQTN